MSSADLRAWVFGSYDVEAPWLSIVENGFDSLHVGRQAICAIRTQSQKNEHKVELGEILLVCHTLIDCNERIKIGLRGAKKFAILDAG